MVIFALRVGQKNTDRPSVKCCIIGETKMVGQVHMSATFSPPGPPPLTSKGIFVSPFFRAGTHPTMRTQSPQVGGVFFFFFFYDHKNNRLFTYLRGHRDAIGLHKSVVAVVHLHQDGGQSVQPLLSQILGERLKSGVYGWYTTSRIKPVCVWVGGSWAARSLYAHIEPCGVPPAIPFSDVRHLDAVCLQGQGDAGHANVSTIHAGSRGGGGARRIHHQ